MVCEQVSVSLCSIQIWKIDPSAMSLGCKSVDGYQKCITCVPKCSILSGILSLSIKNRMKPRNAP